MKQYIIFLRAVTPTGKNKVPMAKLREVLTDAGLSEVRTYIQSGNVLARSNLTAPQVEKIVHDQIKKHFGGDLVIVARTPMQVRQIVADNPFKKEDTPTIYFTILAKPPEKQKVKELSVQNFQPDKFVITDEVVYLYCPLRYGTSKLNNNFIEKKLGVSATTRNYNTMSKLVDSVVV